MASDNPYAALPTQAFWKTAVASVDPLQINLQWVPKFPIDRSTRIITVGSCFAQHISRELVANGFHWLDAEPAPATLPASEHAEQGYGVFSFRTGNIYTAALLAQWVRWAADPATQSTEHWAEGDRVFDPFRPALTPQGFATKEEMLAARTATLRAMLATIRYADLLVFTLGLTEAWHHRDGWVYPMCPGTVRGTFSAADHHFQNHDEQQVRLDLEAAFTALRAINPRLRFLLTVSPVPLTATASGGHVLTATTYSKSVLRSVAGHFASTRADTDYFPSYELIATPPFKGRFYERNLRSVSAAGVGFVMRQFLNAVSGEQSSAAAPSTPSTPGEPAVRSATEVCEEIILETWQSTVDESATAPNLLLLGDSHIGKLAAALGGQGIAFAGGAVMDSSAWFDARFELRAGRRIFEPADADARARWDQVCSTWLDQLDLGQPGTNVCITNVGSNTITPSVSGLLPQYLNAIYGKATGRIDGNVIWGYVQRFRTRQLMLVKSLVDLGFKVVWVTDPPLQAKNPEVHRLIDLVLEEVFAQTGCHVFNARNWMEQQGMQPAAFRRPEMDVGADASFADHHHGSDEYYALLAQELCRRYGIGAPA